LPEECIFVDQVEPVQVVNLFQRQRLHFVGGDPNVPQVL
jgi:hypothetical protein